MEILPGNYRWPEGKLLIPRFINILYINKEFNKGYKPAASLHRIGDGMLKVCVDKEIVLFPVNQSIDL